MVRWNANSLNLFVGGCRLSSRFHYILLLEAMTKYEYPVETTLKPTTLAFALESVSPKAIPVRLEILPYGLRNLGQF